MTHWPESDINVNGHRIHIYRTGHGDKPSLVLSHGFSDNGLCWTRVAAELEAHFDVIMVDARNHGLSGRSTANPGAMADDLAAVINTLQLDHPALLGHSMGAGTVAELAARGSQNLSRVILEDPPWMEVSGDESVNAREKRRKGFGQFLRSLAALTDDELMAQARKLNPAWHENELPAWAASKRQVAEDAMDALVISDWRALVPQINCPVLLVYADGEGDGIVTHDVAAEVAHANARFKLAHIRDAGHNARREQFEAYMQAITEFLLQDSS